MARLREQREKGVALYPTIMPALVPWAEKLGVDGPEAVLIRTRSTLLTFRQAQVRTLH